MGSTKAQLAALLWLDEQYGRESFPAAALLPMYEAYAIAAAGRAAIQEAK